MFRVLKNWEEFFKKVKQIVEESLWDLEIMVVVSKMFGEFFENVQKMEFFENVKKNFVSYSWVVWFLIFLLIQICICYFLLNFVIMLCLIL